MFRRPRQAAQPIEQALAGQGRTAPSSQQVAAEDKFGTSAPPCNPLGEISMLTPHEWGLAYAPLWFGGGC